MEYAKLEPFGEERADIRAAMLAKTVAEAAWVTSGAKGKPPYRLEDFVLRFGVDEDAQIPLSVEQQIAAAEAMAKGLGAVDLRGQDR